MNAMNSSRFDRSRRIRVVAASIIALLTVSCTVGPNYKRPNVEIPSSYRGAGAETGESLADREWFDLFRDDTLTALVTTALKQNFELRIAAERVLQARAVYGISRADRFPTVDAVASADRHAPVAARRHASAFRCGQRRGLHRGRVQPGVGTRCLGTRPPAE